MAKNSLIGTPSHSLACGVPSYPTFCEAFRVLTCVVKGSPLLGKDKCCYIFI